MSTWKQFTRGSILVLGYLVILALLGIGMNRMLMTSSDALSATVFIILLLGATIALVLLMRWMLTPRVYREAQTQGLPATARVLAVEATGWRRRHNPGGWLDFNRPTKREYQLHVHVASPRGAAYEATLFAYLDEREVPQRGSNISVKTHPQQPEIVVLAGEDPQS